MRRNGTDGETGRGNAAWPNCFLPAFAWGLGRGLRAVREGLAWVRGKAGGGPRSAEPAVGEPPAPGATDVPGAEGGVDGGPAGASGIGAAATTDPDVASAGTTGEPEGRG